MKGRNPLNVLGVVARESTTASSSIVIERDDQFLRQWVRAYCATPTEDLLTSPGFLSF